MVAQMDAEKRSEQALLGERLPDATDQPAEVCAIRKLIAESIRTFCNPARGACKYPSRDFRLWLVRAPAW